MHYLTLIQEARRTAESLVLLVDQLPAELVARQLATVERKLDEAFVLLAALPDDKLRGTSLVSEMAGRAVAAINTLRA